MEISDYILGLLYGDGYFQNQNRYEWFFFSTTHKEISDMVKEFLNENSINYFSHFRDFPSEHEKANYETLEIIEVTDRNFCVFLVSKGFKSELANERINWNKDFIRGYLETKGTFFSFTDKNSLLWRLGLSGNEDDVNYLWHKVNELGLSPSKILRRKEREPIGIVSKSFRFLIQNRNGIAGLIKFIEGGQTSIYLQSKFDDFNKWNNETPYNMKRKVFKHYKNAVGFMSRALNISIKGVRGGGGEKGWKPVYLFEGEEQKQMFKGWEEAYNWIKKEYKNKTGFNPPIVDENV